MNNRQLIIGLFLMLFLAVVATSSIFALKKIKKETTNNILSSLQTVLITVQEFHHALITQRKTEAIHYTATPEVIRMTNELLNLHQQNKTILKSKPLVEFRKHISPTLARYGDDGFFVIAPDRISIASMRDANIGTLNLIHLQKEKLLDETFLGTSNFIPTIHSDVILDANFPENPEAVPTMFITAPIRDQKSNIIAVLAFRLDPSKYLSHITSLGRIGDSGETYAFDENGLLITETRFHNQLIRANLIAIGKESVLNVRIADPGGNILTGFRSTLSVNDLPLTVMAASATAGNNGFNVEGYRDYRGVMVFGAWVWNRQLNFGLTTEIDMEEALRPFVRTSETFIAVVSITVVLSLIMLYFIFRIQAESKKRLEIAYDELENRVQVRTSELIQTKEILSKLNEELNILADTDPLTGLSNRRNFDKQLKVEWKRCIRTQNPISIILFDIDYFKQYNDTYGHLMGDKCLKDISTMLMNTNIAQRPGDLLARFGGEEFIILLSNASEQYAQKSSEVLRQEVENMNIPHKDTKVQGSSCVTISIGYATDSKLDDIRSKYLVQKADERLYQAKASGRNRICGETVKALKFISKTDDISKNK